MKRIWVNFMPEADSRAYLILLILCILFGMAVGSIIKFFHLSLGSGLLAIPVLIVAWPIYGRLFAWIGKRFN